MEQNPPIQPVNPPEIPVQTQSIQSPVNNPKNYLPTVLIVLVLLLIVGIGSYYLGMQKYKPSSNPQLQAESTPTNIPITQTQPTQPTVTLIPQNNTKAGWKSYTDVAYGYTIQYPAGWTLKQEKDSEGDNRIRVVSDTASKATFSSRMLPELYITVANPYSTSGAVCANQSCTETPPPLEIKIKRQNLVIPITKGEVIKDGEKQFDFFAFTFPLPTKKVSLQGYSEPVALNAIASYRTIEEGKIIASILSTLSD